MDKHFINLTGIMNARHMGGYTAIDGRHILNNKLLRSGELSKATIFDCALLKDYYHIGLIIDLRTSAEAEADPDVDIPGIKNISVPLVNDDSDSSRDDLFARYHDNPLQTMLHMAQDGYVNDSLYSSIVLSQAGQDALRRCFRLIASPTDNQSILWHCSAGKDRAGILSILIMLALGVDSEIALDEFELSNIYYADQIHFMSEDAAQFTKNESIIEKIRILTGVNRGYMEKMLQDIHAEFHSVENYFEQALGLKESEINKLQELYLRKRKTI